MPLPSAFPEDDDAIIQHVFHVYADVATHRMSNSNFRRLTMDAPNLLTPWFGMVDVDLAYAQARGHSCRRLDVTQFVEALVFLAWRKYPEEAQQDAFLRLLNESIYLLSAAPKLAHARAAEFAVARLGRSANQPDPTTHFQPSSVSVKADDMDDILSDFVMSDEFTIDVDRTGHLSDSVAVESIPSWQVDEPATADAVASTEFGLAQARVATTAYLLATIRAIIKSHQRKQRRRVRLSDCADLTHLSAYRRFKSGATTLLPVLVVFSGSRLLFKAVVDEGFTMR